MATALSSMLAAGVQVRAPDGTYIEIRPLNLRDMADLENQALVSYREQQIKFAKQRCAALYDDPVEAKEELYRLIDELGEMTPDKLPKWKGEVPDKTAVELAAKQAEEVSGKADEAGGALIEAVPKKPNMKPVEIPWVQWWMNFTIDGLIWMTYLAARRADRSLALTDWENRLMSYGPAFVREVSKAVGGVSESKLGNEPELPAAATEAAANQTGRS